ncbi:MAG: hypothetical protein H6560_07145 [Lewinellaceae bacterium]|nr:hypothetical protein [Lewinellaceae bacterium]
MKYFFIALLTLAAIQANAQPETIKTSEGDIIITPVLSGRRLRTFLCL